MKDSNTMKTKGRGGEKKVNEKAGVKAETPNLLKGGGQKRSTEEPEKAVETPTTFATESSNTWITPTKSATGWTTPSPAKKALYLSPSKSPSSIFGVSGKFYYLLGY